MSGGGLLEPAPERNWARVEGLSLPNERPLVAANSSPTLVTTRPKETPLGAAPNRNWLR